MTVDFGKDGESTVGDSLEGGNITGDLPIFETDAGGDLDESTPSGLISGSFGDDLPTVEIGVLGVESGRAGRKPEVLFNLNFDTFGLDVEASASAVACALDVARWSIFSNG